MSQNDLFGPRAVIPEGFLYRGEFINSAGQNHRLVPTLM
jgi:hypothetical protein